MRFCPAILAVGLLLQPVAVWAQSSRSPQRVTEADAIPSPAKPQLEGLTPAEAAALVTKLEAAQQRLKTGAFVSFELLTGSLASNKETMISPRKAFLDLPFRNVWNFKRLPAEIRSWRPFRLAYAPNGIGKLYWEIEVVLGFNDEIERVTLVYKAPAPF